jgi:putative hydrolase
MEKNKLFCDLHVHSIRSTCGFHTLLEIVSIMKSKGLETFAITDHSPVHDTPKSYFSVLLKRLPSVIDGIRVLKGVEATILDTDGTIDLPVYNGHKFDIVLAGLHDQGIFATNPGIEMNTEALVNTMRRNPEVKVITHPTYGSMPVDLDILTDVALETGKALEINNSYILTGKNNPDSLYKLIGLVREKGNLIAVNSDGHIFNEMGEFGLALEALDKFGGADKFRIVNRTRESLEEFLGYPV